MGSHFDIRRSSRRSCPINRGVLCAYYRTPTSASVAEETPASLFVTIYLVQAGGNSPRIEFVVPFRSLVTFRSIDFRRLPFEMTMTSQKVVMQKEASEMDLPYCEFRAQPNLIESHRSPPNVSSSQNLAWNEKNGGSRKKSLRIWRQAREDNRKLHKTASGIVRNSETVASSTPRRSKMLQSQVRRHRGV